MAHQRKRVQHEQINNLFASCHTYPVLKLVAFLLHGVAAVFGRLADGGAPREKAGHCFALRAQSLRGRVCVAVRPLLAGGISCNRLQGGERAGFAAVRDFVHQTSALKAKTAPLRAGRWRRRHNAFSVGFFVVVFGA